MNILAIETSCDETSVSIVRDGRHIVTNVIASQIDLHQRYGGVVPELASRQHIVTIIPVLEEALSRAGMTWVNLDAVAVTRGPGLSPATDSTHSNQPIAGHNRRLHTKARSAAA